MSTTPESEFDLENLFLPAWAAKPADARRFEHVKGDEGAERGERRGGRGDDDRHGRRPPRRDGPRPGGPRGEGPRRDAGPGGGRPPRGDRRGDDRRGGDRRDRGPQGRERFEEPREKLPPPPELDVEILPEHKGVESIIRQIKLTGRAYPVFEIANLILQKPERFLVRLAQVKKPDGQPAQKLFVFSLDNTLWLTEGDVVRYALEKHFATFYATEKTPSDPPKGNYTFVAQCGMSGEILGPPNYHGYQEVLRRVHTERFARMPFEAFKARVKIVRDEAVVKQWLEERSFKTEFSCLNVPEPKKLNTRAEVEEHFRATHLPALLQSVETWEVSGTAARNIPCTPLRNLARHAIEDLRRFPLKLVTYLSQQFANAGLQFFKVNKTVTHVCVARPHFLDLEATPVSDSIKRIVDFLNAHPKCTRRQLMDALVPTPAPAPAPAAPEEPAASPAEGTAPAAEGRPATPAAPAAPAPPELTPEQRALNADLHWLVHQGHVIEFANGIIETAKRPLPKPAPAPPKKPAAPAETTAPAAPASEAPVAEPAPAASAPEAAPAAPQGAAETPAPTANTETPTGNPV